MFALNLGAQLLDPPDEPSPSPTPTPPGRGAASPSPGSTPTPSPTPHRTPWWLILLRLIIAALVIAGLAQPLWNANFGFPRSGPLISIGVSPVMRRLKRDDRSGCQVAPVLANSTIVRPFASVKASCEIGFLFFYEMGKTEIDTE